MESNSLELICLVQHVFNYLQQFMGRELSKMTLNKGKIMFNAGSVLLRNHLEENITNIEGDFEPIDFSSSVKSQNSANLYQVRFSLLRENGSLKINEIRCNCPAFHVYEPYCKHTAALVIQLESEAKSWLNSMHADILFEAMRLNPKTITYSTGKIERKNIPVIEKKETNSSRIPVKGSLSLNFNNSNWESNLIWETNIRQHQLEQFAYKSWKISHSEDEKSWEMRSLSKPEQWVIAEITGKSTIVFTHFDLKHQAVKAKLEIAALCYYIFSLKGIQWFFTFNDYSDEKAKIMKMYGVLPKDPLASQFKFQVNQWGNFELLAVPAGLLPLPTETENPFHKFQKSFDLKAVDENESVVPTTENDLVKHGLLINLAGGLGHDWSIDLLIKKPKKNGGTGLSKRAIKKGQDVDDIMGLTPVMRGALKKVCKEEWLDQNVRNSYSYYNWEKTDSVNKWVDALRNFFVEAGEDLSRYQDLYISNPEMPNKASGFSKVTFSHQPLLDFHFSLEEEAEMVILRVATQGQPSENLNLLAPLFVQSNDTISLAASDIVKFLKEFPAGKVMMAKSAKTAFIKNVVLPLSQKVDIQFNDVITYEKVEVDPLPWVYLSEMDEKFLLFKPIWVYDGTEVPDNQQPTHTYFDGTLVRMIQRNPDKEREFRQVIIGTHQNLGKAANQLLYVHIKDVMSASWFLNTFQTLSEQGFEIFGLDKLKKFKYSTKKAKVAFQVSSGLDWFDVQIEVTYGDEVVPLDIIRQAFKTNSQYVVLGDGTLGLLPEEWLKKFAQLLKFGKVNKTTGDLQIKKMHWTLIDGLYDQIDNNKVLEELLHKREKLKNIHNIESVAMPKGIKAKMRDYQLAGFNWLTTLHQLGWAGCLADDMGLGKTLQTIVFLQYLKQENSLETHLIVCPTSLIFNWENELRKFAPSLDFHIHYGPDRVFDKNVFDKTDIVLTSYGNLRSDIEFFCTYRFGYVILDESQAIKNPVSQIAKSVRLLNTSNRLALSGTPVQNNTFDLYSQFDFLNPGLLGNQEFFRNEFANPIDKYGDKEKTENLRKLTYPFMLRRTKDQVAKDLPAKTETILWCEMDKRQRSIYNALKEKYREEVMASIAQSGMGRSGIAISRADEAAPSLQ